MEWVVTLSGGAHALQELVKVFDTPDLCIQRENGGFILRSKGFRDFASQEEVWESVAKILCALNGATKLAALGSHTPVTIGPISRINDDGTRHAYVTMTSSISVSHTCSVTTIHACRWDDRGRLSCRARCCLAGALEERRTCKEGIILNQG